MKKLLFIVPVFPSISQTFILNQLASLIDLGYFVTILAFDKEEEIIHQKIHDYCLLEGVIYPKFESYGKRVISLFSEILSSKNKRAIIKSINPFKFGVSALKLTNFCKIRDLSRLGKEFDLVHIHFGQMFENYLLLKDVGLLNKASAVLTFHGYDLEEKSITENRRKYNRIPSENIKVTVNTPYLKGIFDKTILDYKKVYVLPVGLDIKLFKPTTNKGVSNIINIVFCGRFIKLKGIERLPSIMKAVINGTKEDVFFHVIGDGKLSDRQHFLNRVTNLGLRTKVEIYGSITQEEIVNIFDLSHIFILPGIYDNGRAETQGLVIQEAQAMKLPVIVTDAGGMKYGLIDDRSGFVVNYKSDDEFVDKILLLINSSNLREKMGIRGRENVVENYNSIKLTEKLIKIYFR